MGNTRRSERTEYPSAPTPNSEEAVEKTLEHLKGSWSIAVMDAEHPDLLICAKHHMPLNIAKADEFMFVSSDIPAALTKSKTVYVMEDDEIAVIPAQLFALALAQTKNLNPDKPRDLAKSVTVE